MKSLAMTMLLVFSLGGSVFAKDRKGGKERFEKMAKELNLSDEQVAKIKEIRKKYRTDLKSLRDEKKESQEELQTLMSSGEKGSTFQTKAKTIHTDLQNKSNTLHDKRFAMMLEIREQLTPEQIKEFKEFKKDRMKKRHKRMQSQQSDD